MSNVEIIRELYDAFSRRDTDTIRDLMHPQIEWVQTQGFPGGDRYVGPDEVFDKVFAPFREQWTEWGADVDDYLDAGDRVIALGFYRGVYKATGKRMEASFAHVYTLHDGRITAFVQYADTAMLRDAMV